MKKAARILLRAGAVGVVGIAVALWCCLEGVDYRPYFKESYYEQTRQAWEKAASSQGVRHGALEAGFGRVALIPGPRNVPDRSVPEVLHRLPLAGYGGRKGRPAQGVHDDLFVKAVAMRVADRLAIMISVDALIIPRDIADAAYARLREEFKVDRAQVYFGATHTHASLGGWGKGWVAEQFAGAHEPAVGPWFTGRLVAAAQAALADLQPASAGTGRVTVPEFVRNRLVGDLGRVDPDLSFLAIQQAKGKTAVVGAYAAHATVLSARNMEFSGDYPGYWQRAIEEATGGIGVFFAAGTGSHSPRPGAPGFTGAERMGQGLAQAVLARLPSVPLTNQVTLGTLGMEVALPELHIRITDSLRLRPWLARRLLPVSPNTFLQVLVFSGTGWVSTPCDFSGELALEIKESCRARGTDAVLTSFNGDYMGYVIPHRYYHLDGYEPRLMSFFGPNIPDYFGELIRTLLASVE